MPRKKRIITAEDLYKFQLLKSCAISPDGEHVAYSLHRVDKKTEKKYSNIWIAPTGGGRPRSFTYGDHSDSSPAWSPDGRQLAFISNRADGKTQLYVIPFRGGEARPITDLQGDFGDFEWSPDGRRIVFSFRNKDAQDIEREADPALQELGVVSRHHTRVWFKLDGYGFLPQGRWHIWTTAVPSGRTRQLTDGDVHDEVQPTWSPDGGRITFISNRSEQPDFSPHEGDLFVIPAAGGRLRKIIAPVGGKSSPRYSPDGKWIAYFAQEGRSHWWKNTNVWVVPANGRGDARNLTGRFDLDTTAATLNDMGGMPEQPRPTWSPDGETIYFQISRHGNVELRSISLQGKRPDMQTVIDGEGVVGAFSFDTAHAELAYFYGAMDHPGQIFVRALSTGADRQLTRVNEALLRGINLGTLEMLWFKGKAGNDLQGWILKPPGFRKNRKYPCIIEIHGGPLAQYGAYFMHEFYYLAAQGYVVAFSNPRGGQGYGEKHAKAIWGKWGTVDYDDVMSFANLVGRRAYVDARRMGVTGGSYGGYMTNWIIGHTTRFKAAVTQRSVSNLVSMYGSSDYNWFFEEEIGGNKPPWENHNRYWQQSPMKYIGNARTPTLVIHSEQDLRCDIEQGEQVFVALQRLGVDSEMVRFPDEPHGLSRAGGAPIAVLCASNTSCAGSANI